MIYDLDNRDPSLVGLQRPTDQTRARGYLLRLASSHLARVVFKQEMTVGVTVQMSLDIHSMAAIQGPQYGSSSPWDRCRSCATRINECADVPASWSVPYLWMCLPARPVSFEVAKLPQARFLTKTLGLIFWLGNSSTFGLKFMRPSMAAKRMGAFQTLTSPSA